MALDPTVRRSRRAVLAAAAGGAAGALAATLSRPATVAAANPPLLLDQDNAATAMTSITGNGITGFKVTTGAMASAIWGVSNSGNGVIGTSDSEWGVDGQSTSGVGVHGVSGSGPAFEGNSTSGPGIDVTSSTGQAVAAHVGTGPAAIALLGTVSLKTQVGIRAGGRVQFPDRSGRVTIGKGKSSIGFLLAGVTSSNFAIAMLGANRANRYVRAVVCSAGKITIYLNAAVTSPTYITYLVLG